MNNQYTFQKRMVQQALDHADMNIITVDWSNGARNFNLIRPSKLLFIVRNFL